VGVVLGVSAVVEFGDVVAFEAVDVAAKTHGVAMSAAATTMPAIAASYTVLVFILSSMVRSAFGYLLDFRDAPKISTDSVQEASKIGSVRLTAVVDFLPGTFALPSPPSGSTEDGASIGRSAQLTGLESDGTHG